MHIRAPPRPDRNGGRDNRDDTIRTCDHLLPKQALYQLSYIPEAGKSSTARNTSEGVGFRRPR